MKLYVAEEDARRPLKTLPASAILALKETGAKQVKREIFEKKSPTNTVGNV